MASMKEVLANRVNPTTYESHKKKMGINMCNLEVLSHNEGWRAKGVLKALQLRKNMLQKNGQQMHTSQGYIAKGKKRITYGQRKVG
jgi:hypothetical protein